MLATIGTLVFLAAGLPPAEMATIVADRLARLDRLVVEIEAQHYISPGLTSPLDSTAWSGPLEPGDGARRVLRIVRPGVLEESFLAARPDPIVTSFIPGRVVRRVGASPRSGRVVYSIDETIYSGTYTCVTHLQMLDLQVHESHVAGLNLLSLLRDYPAQLVASDGETSTYAVTLENQYEPAGTWMEHYEFDLNTRGTPMRFQTIIETSRGFRFEREFLVRQTQELNGAELVTEALAIATNSVVDNYSIDHLVVCAADIDPDLSREGLLFEPERRNAAVWTRTWPIDPTAPEQYQEYNEEGQLIASTQGHRDEVLRRQMLVPVALACGLVGALCVAFISGRAAHRRATRPT